MRRKDPGRTGIGAKRTRGETTQETNGIRGETTRYPSAVTMSMPITHTWPYHALELSELSY